VPDFPVALKRQYRDELRFPKQLGGTIEFVHSARSGGQIAR
jgi:hypothetical protein